MKRYIVRITGPQNATNLFIELGAPPQHDVVLTESNVERGWYVIKFDSPLATIVEVDHLLRNILAGGDYTACDYRIDTL